HCISTIIKYPYLTSLYLGIAHDGYSEQFLNDKKKSHLFHLTNLAIG
ncbi:unnamed protein product, partial [Rotaria socialis]